MTEYRLGKEKTPMFYQCGVKLYLEGNGVGCRYSLSHSFKLGHDSHIQVNTSIDYLAMEKYYCKTLVAKVANMFVMNRMT